MAKVIRVSSSSDKAIRAYASRKGVTVTEAADAMLGLAASRHASLEKQGAKRKKARAKAKSKRKA